MTRHYFDIDHERDPEHDDGLPECEVRVRFVFHPYQREQGPSYASGGEPAEPAFVEFDGAQIKVNGEWVKAPEALGAWAASWLENDGYEIAMEQAGADNEPDPDHGREDAYERRQMEREMPTNWGDDD